MEENPLEKLASHVDFPKEIFSYSELPQQALSYAEQLQTFKDSIADSTDNTAYIEDLEAAIMRNSFYSQQGIAVKVICLMAASI